MCNHVKYRNKNVFLCCIYHTIVDMKRTLEPLINALLLQTCTVTKGKRKLQLQARCTYMFKYDLSVCLVTKRVTTITQVHCYVTKRTRGLHKTKPKKFNIIKRGRILNPITHLTLESQYNTMKINKTWLFYLCQSSKPIIQVVQAS